MTASESNHEPPLRLAPDDLATRPHGWWPLVRETIAASREGHRLRHHPVWHGHGVARGEGQPVVLVPGFLAGDNSLDPMASWLGRLGYKPVRTGMRVNAGCLLTASKTVERRAEAAADTAGTPVAIVGHSRGGQLARLVAVRRPDLVTGIVTLGSPLTEPMAAHAQVMRTVRWLAALGELGVPGLMTRDCLEGDCGQEVLDALHASPLPAVSMTSVYSRRDGIVDWRSSLDPAAECVEVSSSHLGMAVNPDVYSVIGDRLDRLGRSAKPSHHQGETSCNGN